MPGSVLRKTFATLLPAVLAFSGCGDRPAAETTVSDPVESDTVFVQLEGGEFVTSAGDTVFIQPFELMRTEVTNRLYVLLADEADLDLPPDPGFPAMENYITAFPDCPVLNVSPIEADSAASVLEGRLPTSAELEYAASRGLGYPFAGSFPWGSLEPSEAGFPASYLTSDDWDLRNQDGYLFTAPAGSFPLSTAGFADLAGNVAEITRPVEGVSALFGGSWLSPTDDLRLGAYQYLNAGDRARHAGFRIAR